MIRAAALLACLVLAAVAVAPTPAEAQAASGLSTTLPPGVTPADRTAIEQVIRRQMQAFQADDAAGAYAYAAPNIRRLFPDPGTFLDMVRRGYAPVYRPQSTEFSELAERDGEIVQDVELVGPDGQAMVAVYTVQRMPDGHWLISGCVLMRSTRLGV